MALSPSWAQQGDHFLQAGSLALQAGSPQLLGLPEQPPKQHAEMAPNSQMAAGPWDTDPLGFLVEVSSAARPVQLHACPAPLEGPPLAPTALLLATR